MRGVFSSSISFRRALILNSGEGKKLIVVVIQKLSQLVSKSMSFPRNELPQSNRNFVDAML
jgi:hypothetical protein